MINYNSASALRSFMEQEGLGMQKKFGQNFLINPATRNALADALGAAQGDEVWEVGPGLGAMTTLLLEKGLKVKAFEIDKGFIRILNQLFTNDKNFTLVEGDVMKTWVTQTPISSISSALIRVNPRKSAFPVDPALYLLGNLPYNIAAALLADFIEKGCLFKRMVVTVQKEVALRMAASAGSADYSSFSVLCSSVYNVKPLMTIRPSSFYPQPNVDSMGVLLENRKPPSYPPVFYPLVRALFASRRKTIKNNMTAFLSSKELCASVLQENALTGNERAENLEPEVFLSLAKSIQNMRL
jgi:16S rRNA (adenine1518-N6/adenine1519-N6)-dimethyltransferase